jgi:phosphate transport system protein
MIRKSFSEHIQELEHDVIGMGQKVIAAINRSLSALKAQDLDEARRVIEGDKEINQMRWDLEERCITLMATQQPVATDLR